LCAKCPGDFSASSGKAARQAPDGARSARTGVLAGMIATVRAESGFLTPRAGMTPSILTRRLAL